MLDDKGLNGIETKSALFKKQLPNEKLAIMFRPSLPPNGKYNPILRAKIEIGDGACRVRTWDSNGGAVELPSDWKDLKVAARLEVKGGVLLSSSMIGLSIDATDIMLCEMNEQVLCPFGF